MPKVVNHDERRDEIAEALLDLVAGGGLEQLSLRRVAAQAGLSMGSVQHYFATKDEMLLHALDYQYRMMQQRGQETFAQVSPSPRTLIRWSLLEMLPAEDYRRREWLVGIAYFIRALSTPEMRKVYIEGIPLALDFLAAMVGQAQQDGDVPSGLDPEQEAQILMGIADAQGAPIALGARTVDDAVATIDYYLDRLFAGG